MDALCRFLIDTAGLPKIGNNIISEVGSFLILNEAKLMKDITRNELDVPALGDQTNTMGYYVETRLPFMEKGRSKTTSGYQNLQKTP